MSIARPPESTTAGSETATLPRFRAIRLRQVVDVSSAPPNSGDSLVYNKTSGQWAPQNITPGAGSITNTMLAANSVTSDKIADGTIVAADLAAGAATDTVIGNRTITDTVNPVSDTGTITTLLGNLAAMIKAITGKGGWKILPSISLESLNLHASRHASGGADPLIGSTVNAPANNVSPFAGTTLTQASRVDHHHGTAPIVNTTGTSGLMTSADKSKLDGIATGATATPLATTTPDAIAVGQTGAVGTVATAAHADHSHAAPGLVSTINDGFMSHTDKTKLDGVEIGATNTPLSTTAPASETVGASTNVGVGTTVARADHRHQMPGLATSTINGFMSGIDKGKIDTLGTYYIDESIGTDYTIINSPSPWLDIPNISLTPTAAGIYLIVAVFDFVNTGDGNQPFEFAVYQGGVQQIVKSISTASGTRVPINVTFISFLATGSAVTIRARKTAGSGSSVIDSAGTALYFTYIHE
jgi:hypothetical protein